MAAPALVLSPGAGASSAGTILCELIRKWEGLRLKAYRCPAGVATVGYGSTGSDITITTVWTLEQAESRLQQDAARSLLLALRHSPVLADQPKRHAAIADFIYNLGIGRYLASTLKRRVDAEDWAGAAGELSKWVWGGGKKLPGLVARREDEAKLMRN